MWAKISLVQWLFLPLFGVEPHKGIVRLHLDPAHLISDVHPALWLEELGRAELGLIIGHVIKHVEKNGIRERLYCALGQSFWLAHVVTLGNSNINLEAVIIVGIVKVLSLLANWAKSRTLHHGTLHWRGLIVTNLKCLVHQLLCILFVVL